MNEHSRWFWRQDFATRDRVFRGINFSKRLRAIAPVAMAGADFRVMMALQAARELRNTQ